MPPDPIGSQPRLEGEMKSVGSISGRWPGVG